MSRPVFTVRIMTFLLGESREAETQKTVVARTGCGLPRDRSRITQFLSDPSGDNESMYAAIQDFIPIFSYLGLQKNRIDSGFMRIDILIVVRNEPEKEISGVVKSVTK